MCEDSKSLLFVSSAEHLLAVAALRRGDLDGAIRRWGAHRSSAADSPAPPDAFLEAQLAWAVEGPERAFGLLAPVYREPVAHLRLFLEEPAGAAWLVRLALTLDHGRAASAIVACSRQLAAANPTYPLLAAGSGHATGLLERDSRALDAASRGYLHPWDRGTALEDGCRVLDEAGDRDGAIARGHEAVAAYETAGATRDSRRTARRVDDLRRQTGRNRTRHGWSSLTVAERRVAEVVAEGLTNVEAAHRLFLSRHTVDFHLRQIFRKLEVRSRVELARALLDRESRLHARWGDPGR
jgi:DNA-binding CsgD family transcriptional regulator